MKTTNNVQKTATRLTAIITGIIFISFSVSAQHVRKEHHSNEVVFAFSGNYSANKPVFDTHRNTSKPFEFYLETNEEEMELEDWMTNDSHFLRTTNIEAEKESPMEIENWMIDESYFRQPQKLATSILQLETEEELKLESWMINNRIWKI